MENSTYILKKLDMNSIIKRIIFAKQKWKKRFTLALFLGFSKEGLR